MSEDPVQVEYARLAAIYDRRWRFYIDATLKATLQHLAIAPESTILDVGCGTGLLLQQLSERYPAATLVGLDSSAEMLAVAREKLSPAIALHLGEANQLPFSNQQFDYVISTSAFHYFRNPSKVLQEFSRILKLKGCLIITDWCRDYWSMFALNLWLRYCEPAHFRAYKSHELQAMLTATGFQHRSIHRYRINWFWGMMTAVAIKNSEGDRPLSAD